MIGGGRPWKSIYRVVGGLKGSCQDLLLQQVRACVGELIAASGCLPKASGDVQELDEHQRYF